MFTPGELYRRRDLHTRYNGQQQGGISTPQRYPIIFLFSGPGGEQYGYKDAWDDDGFYHYTGEGQTGDMTLTKGNAAISNHFRDGKDLHLFLESGKRGWARYEGQMAYCGHEWVERPDHGGRPRKAIVFTLAPTEGEELQDVGAAFTEADQISQETDLARLRERALAQPTQASTPQARRVLVRARSTAARRYALVRAGGRCEGCGSPAPFRTSHGEAFLEVHHLRRLTDGGPANDVSLIAAICPNCHRHAHLGEDGSQFNEDIKERVIRIEARIALGKK